jgi:regulator of replication initiation timing
MNLKTLNTKRFNEIASDFMKLRQEYISLEPGYNSRAHLQHLRKQMTELYTQVSELIKEAKFNKIATEHYRQVVLSQETLNIIDDKDVSVAKADKLARDSTGYKQHIDITAESDSDWEMVRHLADSLRQYIYTLASDIDGINEPKY